MISKLDHTQQEIGEQIWNIFQASYAVEAELLKVLDFPPLKRSVENFIASTTDFYMYLKDDEPAAVVEIEAITNCTHIQSLVVLPGFFRQGIASALLHFVFDTYGDGLFTVATGRDNKPATTLYEKLGFTKTKQWYTDHEILKVSYELLLNNSPKI